MPGQITSEISQVGGAGFTAAEDAAVYLINFQGHGALVDAGCGGQTQQLLTHIDQSGVAPDQIQWLLLTHCHYDHTGGGAALLEMIAATSVCHALDAQFIEAGNDTVTAATWYGGTLTPFSIGHKLSRTEETILLAGRPIVAIHTPGHSPGAVAYMVESDRQKVLFAHDVHGPLHSSFLSNRSDYRHSLKRLMDLEADILCEGHYGVFKGKKKVRRFIRSYLNAA
jgi:glyoxylase-like metal-dependent hydrolase (beta-lactamase superfamily II)